MRRISNDRHWSQAACALSIAASLLKCTCGGEAGGAAIVSFNRDIRPILAENCFKCHGPIRAQSGLRLDSRERMLAEADSGASAVVAGKSDESELIARVSSTDSRRMPPKTAGKALSGEQIDKLKAWIDQGAAWESHWAYATPTRPSVPRVKSIWTGSPIDQFVVARLNSEQLRPASEADRYTLIRRVSLDLVGLPPSIEEVDAFVNDPRPDAYEMQVERLLASPAFGERWARVWLDAARYADTQGYEKDNRRTIWRYRDWVIAAFNKNLTFDQFTIEQLAGDLLPHATTDQLIATAFHRNTMTNTEGGTDNEEFRVAAIIDRISGTMQTWMATTIGCVQCHDHPYDGIAHDEFYRVFAFFNNTEDNDNDNEHPTLPTPTEAELARNVQLEAALRELNLAAERQTKEVAIGQHRWEKSHPTPPKGVPEPIAKILAVPAPQRTHEQRALLTRHYRTIAPELKSIRDKIVQAQQSIANITTTPILRELPDAQRRDTHVFVRGSFLSKGAKVTPGVPAMLPPFGKGRPINRLGFAQWLVDPQNPLTARVFVNRLWEQLFGAGLVTSSDDFGTQALPATHPELLDWLACETIRQNWDMKTMLRQLVTSAVYRQSSRADADLVRRDQDNRLLARGPRFRMEAETVRDQALAISGLLSRKMYGPSVMPPQPDGVWQVVYSGDQWVTSEGADRYRRGVYTFWRRTSPYPSMVAFDAPSREYCVLRRIRTNTPLQSLVTMNDPAYLESAQALAKRMLTEISGGPPDRAALGFRLCLGRPPIAAERARLLTLYQTELEHFRQNENAAREFLGIGQESKVVTLNLPELAAWTVVANVLLNLDELLSKG